MTMERLEDELLKLSSPEKKHILRKLISDLDEGRDADAERVWLEEAQRRHSDLKEGRVETVSAGDAIIKARDRLDNAR